MCEDAGFAATHMDLDIASWPPPPAKIEGLLKVSPNPLWPTPSEVMDKIFTAEERARFIEYMRPLVESGKGIARFQQRIHRVVTTSIDSLAIAETFSALASMNSQRSETPIFSAASRA